MSKRYQILLGIVLVLFLVLVFVISYRVAFLGFKWSSEASHGFSAIITFLFCIGLYYHYREDKKEKEQIAALQQQGLNSRAMDGVGRPVK